MLGNSLRRKRNPCRTATPRSSKKARIWLMMPVRRLTSRSLTRCNPCRSSWSAVWVATNFIAGRCTASARPPRRGPTAVRRLSDWSCSSKEETPGFGTLSSPSRCCSADSDTACRTRRRRHPLQENYAPRNVLGHPAMRIEDRGEHGEDGHKVKPLVRGIRGSAFPSMKVKPLSLALSNSIPICRSEQTSAGTPCSRSRIELSSPGLPLSSVRLPGWVNPPDPVYFLAILHPGRSLVLCAGYCGLKN